MPLLRKTKELEKVEVDDGLKDNDEVFYCAISKEIFRNYDDYFERMMLFNSTVWTCAMTSRPNLTYAEALESEKNARKLLKEFVYELKAPIVFVASLTKRTGISDMVDDVFHYIQVRYFKEEEVFALETADDKEIWRECEVLNVFGPNDSAQNDSDNDSDNAKNKSNALVEISPEDVKYRVKRIDTEKPTKPFIVPLKEIRRRRAYFNRDKLKLFLKQCVECNDKGMLIIKKSAYEKYVTDGGVRKYNDFFPGKPPTFECSKVLLTKMNKLSSSTAIKKKQPPSSSDKKSSSNNGKKDNVKKNNSKEKSASSGGGGSSGSSSGNKKKSKSDTKQPDISKYFGKDGNTKNNNDNMTKKQQAAAVAAKNKENEKSLKEEMLRMKQQIKEREEREAALKKKQAEERDRLNKEILLAVQTTLRTLNQHRDDLELRDQKIIPLPKPVNCLIPQKYFGRALQIMEFVNSFSTLLEDKDKFPRGYNLSLLERSLLCRELAGPLSDIIQVLLGSIFSLQMDEESEVEIEYVPMSHFDNVNSGGAGGGVVKTESIMEYVKDATMAAHWSRKYFDMSLRELPMDATTVSELLRLHFLMSGAKVAETGARWQYQQRGGYSHVDDPGLEFRIKYPHVLRALGRYTVYQLPISDILKILQCLIGQILTYSTIRDMTEERLSNAWKSKIALKNAQMAERKREHGIAADKKAATDEMKKKLDAFEGTPEEKIQIQTSLTKVLETKLESIDFYSEKAKTQSLKAMSVIQESIFSYQMLLGQDRAFRSYWLFESLPGLFIEHQPYGGRCYETPVENMDEFAYCSSSGRYHYIKHMVAEKMNGVAAGNNDKENKVDNNIGGAGGGGGGDNKKKNNGVLVTTSHQPSALATSSSSSSNDTAKKLIPTTARDLFMCTGKSDTCPVHQKQDPRRTVWSFLNTEEEFTALLTSLNCRGVREKSLHDQLEQQKDLILNHIKMCPTDKLQIDPGQRDKKIKDLYDVDTKQYGNANMKFPQGLDLNNVVRLTLIDNILDLEAQITGGHLGLLRVKNREVWREALLNENYDMQADSLTWGPNGQFFEGKNKQHNGTVLVNGKANKSKIDDDDDDIDEKEIVYRDPGGNLGNSVDFDETAAMAADGTGAPRGADDMSDSDEGISLHDSEQERQTVHNYAKALLQISQGIEQKFFKLPFGVLKDFKDPLQQEKCLVDGRKRLEMWSISLMNATNYSQVFLHYNILNDSIKWARSSLNATCIFCRRRAEPEKMLLCDGCNCGKHLFCFRPKLTKVPEADWYCDKCKRARKPDPAKKVETKSNRKIFSIDSGDEEDIASDSSEELDSQPTFYKHVETALDSDFMDDCENCGKPGRVMLECVDCFNRYHLKCVEPPLKAKPNKKWHCTSCREKPKVANKSDAKRSMPPKAAKRRQSTSSDDEMNEPVTKKRSRRAVADDSQTSEDENSDEDDESDNEIYVKPMVTKKTSTRVAAKQKKPAVVVEDEDDDDDDEDNDAEDEEDEEKDDEEDNDEEESSEVEEASSSDDDIPLMKSRRIEARKPSARNKRKSSTKKTVKKVENARNSRTRKSGSSRRSGPAAKRSKTNSDDDFDGENDRPNTSRRTKSFGRRSNRDESNDDNILLDSVVFYDLLSEIAKHKCSWPFERPVSKNDVPDYYDVITTPMDFAKIKSKLNMGDYRTVYDIMNDIQLIFSNCDLYNMSGSPIYDAGVELEKFLQKRCVQLKIPFKPSDMIADFSENQN